MIADALDDNGNVGIKVEWANIQNTPTINNKVLENNVEIDYQSVLDTSNSESLPKINKVIDLTKDITFNGVETGTNNSLSG